MATVVVVVDDDADMRDLLALAAHTAGHAVVRAANGAAALDEVRRHRPALVVSDLDMPGLTGLHLCRTIRSTPDLAHLPVIIVSAGHDLTDRAAQAGATAALAKPFRVRDLAHLIEHTLTATPDTRGVAAGKEPAEAIAAQASSERLEAA